VSQAVISGGRPARKRRSARPGSLTVVSGLGLGVALVWFSLLVLIPLAMVVATSGEDGWAGFWGTLTNPQTLSAVRLTVVQAFLVTLLNVVMGTMIAWVLVRDRFPGKRILDVVIDIPFALPTIVAGLTLLALYGPRGPVGVNVAYTKVGLTLALLFVTLPFVVRTVQPVLLELDTEMEEAARSLGARPAAVFRRIVFPSLLPAILSGAALAFARALGEFGAVVLISGNQPFRTEVAAVYIFGQIESDNVTAAAAVSVVLLGLSLLVLFAIGGVRRWATRHDG
jgi:sulfate/thiosulfate transport system permease protein